LTPVFFTTDKAEKSRRSQSVKQPADYSQLIKRIIPLLKLVIRPRIPVAAVPGIAFNLVQHGMNPAGKGIVFVLLNDFMGLVLVASQRGFCRCNELAFIHHG
jgi:hypothetical protein